MTTCIKCGAPIADGELFCAQCAQNGTAEQPRPAPLPAGRMQIPPRGIKQPPEPAKPAAKKRACSPAAGILAVCCVLLLAAGVFLYLTGSAKLRSQQTELDRLREETAFFDQYAVCVNVGSEWYHRYGCARFVPENFEILNEKLATAEGYLPCPDCAGQ